MLKVNYEGLDVANFLSLLRFVTKSFFLLRPDDVPPLPF